MELKDFVEQSAQQFLITCELNSIIKPDEIPQAKEMLSNINSINYVDNERFSMRVVSHKKGYKLYVNSDYKSMIENATFIDDPILDKFHGSIDPVKKCLFHEFIHVLQYDKETDVMGFYLPHLLDPQLVGNGLNEAAAAMGEEFAWSTYLGMHPNHTNARVELYLNNLREGEIGIPRTFSDETYDETMTKLPFYYREMDIADKLTEKINMPPAAFVRASTVFGNTLRQKMIRNYEHATGKDFKNFMLYIDRITYNITQGDKKNYEEHQHNFLADYGRALDGICETDYTKKSLSKDKIFTIKKQPIITEI